MTSSGFIHGYGKSGRRRGGCAECFRVSNRVASGSDVKDFFKSRIKGVNQSLRSLRVALSGEEILSHSVHVLEDSSLSHLGVLFGIFSHEDNCSLLSQDTSDLVVRNSISVVVEVLGPDTSSVNQLVVGHSSSSHDCRSEGSDVLGEAS